MNLKYIPIFFSRVYILYCDSEEHRYEWITALRLHADDGRDKRSESFNTKNTNNNSSNNPIKVNAITSNEHNNNDNNQNNPPFMTPNASTNTKQTTVYNQQGSIMKPIISQPLHLLQQQHQLSSTNLLNLDITNSNFLSDTSISSNFSSWRRNLSYKGLNESLDVYFNVKSLKKQYIYNNANVLEFHNKKNFIVIGHHASLSKRSNVNSIHSHGKLRFIKIKDKYDDLSSHQKLKQQQDEAGSLKYTNSINTIHASMIFDISWENDSLLVGSNQGRVLLYHLSQSKIDIDNHNKTLDIAANTIYSHENVINNSYFTHAIPGKYINVNNVYQVKLNSNDQSTFLSLCKNGYHLWDSNHEQKPIYSAFTNSPLYSMDWNRHSSTIFTCAGLNGTLSIIDTRINPNELSSQGGFQSVWQAKAAHDGSINVVKWSPLIDTWIASGGEDGLIKIWDTRYAKQAIINNGTEQIVTNSNYNLTCHIGSIKTIAWSYEHPELLVSGGIDSTMKLWNLTCKPYCLINSHELENADNSPIIGASFSKTLLSQIITVNTDGNIDSIKLSNNLLHNFVHHRKTAILHDFEPPFFKNNDLNNVSNDSLFATPSGDNIFFTIYKKT